MHRKGLAAILLVVLVGILAAGAGYGTLRNRTGVPAQKPENRQDGRDDTGGVMQTTLPAILHVFPASAPPRTAVTLAGSGFTQTGNIVHFGTEVIPDVPSADSKTVVFTVPSGCRGGSPCAPGTYTTVSPGSYNVYVANEKGISNSVVFTVVEIEECAPRCTTDTRELCSPDGKERESVPSNCSCGVLDAKTLMLRGWVDCR